MPSPLTVSLGNKNLTINSGDLTLDTFTRFKHAGLALISDATGAIHDRPISSISSDKLEASIGSGTRLNWVIGKIGLWVTPEVQGTLTLRKAGEVFRYCESENDNDDARRHIFTVPPGSAYVSIALRVNIQIAGSGAFSSGHFGIAGSAVDTDTFLLANHYKVDASTPIHEAIQAAFEHFVIPFTATAYQDVAPDNFLEYQFHGSLNVALQASLGFSGVLFGGLSGGELRRTFSSEIGSITGQVKPQADLSLGFGVNYQHQDAFRIVLNGMADHSRLFLFKMDHNALSAGVQAGFGLSVNAAITLQAQVNDLIDKTAQKLFSAVSDAGRRKKLIDLFVSKVKGTKGMLDKYVLEAQQKINAQLLKLNRLKVNAALTLERMSEHAALLSIDFARTPAAAAGYQKAIEGDMAGALQSEGATLAPDSYIRSEIRHTTSLSLQFFETFRATSVEAYFDKSEIRYAGNGLFHLRLATGMNADNNIFGHHKSIEFYFEVTASSTVKGAISDQDINLRINTFEQNDAEAAGRSAALLHILLKGTASEGADDQLRKALADNPKLAVSVAVVFRPSAYQGLRFTPFAAPGKPPADQPDDARNYTAFVNAVNAIYDQQGFPDSVREFRSWAHYNITACDEEASTSPPDRRRIGNSNTASIWPRDPANFPAAEAASNLRPILWNYMMAAQQFMNFCEDLPALSHDLSEADTREKLAHVLDEAKYLVKEGAGGFPLFFTKPLIAALLALSGGKVTSVQAPGPGEAISSGFAVSVGIA